MIVPIVTAVTIRTACTSRKDVGLEWPTVPDQARWSFQIAIAKRGQISQLKAPASTRNTDQLRERITPSVSRRPGTGGSHWVSAVAPRPPPAIPGEQSLIQVTTEQWRCQACRYTNR
jgi:hypothetical protein